MAYDNDKDEKKLKYSLEKCRGISPDPLFIKDMPMEVQSFIYAQSELFVKFMERELSQVQIRKSGNIQKFLACLLTYVWLRIDIKSSLENFEVKLSKIIDGGYLLNILQKHLLLFKFFDIVEIQPQEWMLIQCDHEDIQIIIFASSIYQRNTIVQKIRKAMLTAKENGWIGNIYYSRCDEETSIPII